MSPILGIFASRRFAATDYESIATVTVGVGGAMNVSFTAIPSTYTHLQLRLLVKTSRTSNVLSSTPFIFNSDSSSSYSQHELSGNGTTASASALGSPSAIDVGRTAGNTGATNVFGLAVIDILDYSNTNKFKTIRMLNGFDNNGAGVISLCSGAYRSTSAISSITFQTPFDAATGYMQYSSFALYGIK